MGSYKSNNFILKDVLTKKIQKRQKWGLFIKRLQFIFNGVKKEKIILGSNIKTGLIIYKKRSKTKKDIK